MGPPPQDQELDRGPPPLRRPWARRWRPLAVILSIAVHVAILFALFGARSQPPRTFDPEPMTVALVAGLRPAEVQAPPTPAPPSPAQPPPMRDIARPTPRAPAVDPLPAGEADTEEPGVSVSDADLAQAATAGSGAAGRACDMTRGLQAALRRNAQVQAASARAQQAIGAASKAIMIWNGDWIRTLGQDGKGLAGVREAMMMEIAFAPAACRAEPMRGLVLITLSDSPGSPRIAFGTSAWRWSDLLIPGEGVPGHRGARR